MWKVALIRLSGLVVTLCSLPSVQAAEPTRLQCEFQQSPLGIDVARPRLSWAMQHTGSLVTPTDVPRGLRQIAFRVLVASSTGSLEKNHGDMWDSGVVRSDKSTDVEYGGKRLLSGKRYHWKVQLWGNLSHEPRWSQPSAWTMGYLQSGDWKALWIGPKLPPAVKVLSARFETLDGTVSADVTGRLNELISAQQGGFKVSPDALGDPALGKLKQLKLIYVEDGVQKKATVAEGANLPFPKNAAGSTSRWFRKEIKLPKKPESALLTVNSLGYFELYVNGVKAGKDVLTPAVSELKAQNFSTVYDVSKLLVEGNNCIGLWCGKGWSDATAIRAQLDAVIDGKSFRVGTDSSWLTQPSDRERIGNRTWNDFGGERVDARRSVPNWNRTGIDVKGWEKSELVAGPSAPTMNQPCPTNTIGKVIPAVAIRPMGENRFEVDFGTNLTGFLRMRMPTLPVGHKVTFHFADKVFRNGVHESPIGNISISTGSVVTFPTAEGMKDSYQTYSQKSEFISGGKPGEVFENKFNYAGFRVVVIEGLPTEPKKEDINALLVESDLEKAGSFTCSDDLIKKIHRLNQWTLRCLNLGGYMVDCPTRERMGYGGDGQTSLIGMMMNFDSARFYEKWAQDWRQAQNPQNGSLANVAPWGGGGGGPPWPGITSSLPWQHYLHYGSRRVLDENYTMAKRYVEYLDSKSKDEILRAWGDGLDFLGDWVPPFRGMDSNNAPSKTAAELVNNCYRVYLWQIVEKMARVLGRKEDAKHCQERIAKIRPAVHSAFFDSLNTRYVIDEQIYYVLPLMTGVTPEKERGKVMSKLVECIQIKSGGHLDTGLIGTTLLMEFLQKEGRDDLILGMYQKKSHPGWGYMVEQGATTVWEQWNGFWSQIHACFVSADNWLYQGLVGIRPDPTGPGFKKVVIKPAVVGDLTWAKGHHDSMYGRVMSSWNRENELVTLSVTIPPNTSATVYIPATDAQSVKESGKPAGKARGVKFIGMARGAAVYSVGSGNYRFESRMVKL